MRLHVYVLACVSPCDLCVNVSVSSHCQVIQLTQYFTESRSRVSAIHQQ